MTASFRARNTSDTMQPQDRDSLSLAYYYNAPHRDEIVADAVVN